MHEPKRASTLVICFLSLWIPWGLANAAPPSLSEIYQKTLERAESVEIQKILVEQAQNNESRAQAKLFPTLDSAANYTYQGRDASGATPSSVETSTLARVGVRQPLFRGGALTSALEIAKIDVRRSQTLEKQTHWQLWWLVTQTYYQVLRYEKSLENYEELERVLNRRQSEISRRVNLGRSRSADLQSTISQRHTVLAQIQSLRTALEVGRLQLQQLSGFTDLRKLSRPNLPPLNTADADSTSQVRSQRPDLELRSLNLERSRKEVDVANAGLFPELNLVGNYYPYRNDTFATFQNSLRWEAGLQLVWVLDFEELNLSQRKDRQLNQQLEEVRQREALRASNEEYARKLEQRKGAAKQITDLQTAVSSSEKALKALQSDFRSGTVGLLDVVAQENSYWELKRQYDTLVLDVDLMGWELLWLNGQMPQAMSTPSTEAKTEVTR